MELLKQNYVKYGLIMTAGLFVCLGLMEITGNNQSFEDKSPVSLLYQFIFPAFVWYFGLKAKRNWKKGN